jgi:hypothetical protein
MATLGNINHEIYQLCLKKLYLIKMHQKMMIIPTKSLHLIQFHTIIIKSYQSPIPICHYY